MNKENLWRHSTSALFTLCAMCALCAALLVAPGAGLAQKAAFAPPDPASFGARMEAGDLAKAREWLEAGLDPDYVAGRIGTGLMIAAWNGDLAMMKLFLDAPGNVIAARLESSSGHALLDDAAVRAARTLRALPDSAPREALLPVRFRLR